MYPSPGQVWQSKKKGTEYVIQVVGNEYVDPDRKDEFSIIQIAYRGADGKDWIIPIDRFLDRMEFLREA